jgi:hypothetical protein
MINDSHWIHVWVRFDEKVHDQNNILHRSLTKWSGHQPGKNVVVTWPRWPFVPNGGFMASRSRYPPKCLYRPNIPVVASIGEGQKPRH